MTTEAYPDRYVRDGVTHQADDHGWVEAIRTSPADDPADPEPIHVHGGCNLLELSSNTYNRWSILRPQPISVRLVGGNREDPPKLRSLFVGDEGGGVAKVVFKSMVLDASGAQGPYPFVTVQNPKKTGTIGVVDCTLLGRADIKYVRTILRTYGFKLRVRRCKVLGKMQEYVFYWNGCEVDINGVDCSQAEMGRGFSQGVLRAQEDMESTYTADAVTTIRGITTRNTGWDGSSVISLTGHPGRIQIADVDFFSKHKTGGIYIRWDKHQNLLKYPNNALQSPILGQGVINQDLRAHRLISLDMRGSSIRLPQTDRDAILVDSADNLWVSSDGMTTVSSPKRAMHVEANGAGIIKSTSGEQVAKKSVAALHMAGEYGGWKNTTPGGGFYGAPFARNGSVFEPEEYWSPR